MASKAMSSVTCLLLAGCEVEYKRLIINALMGLRPKIKDLDAINKKIFDATSSQIMLCTEMSTKLSGSKLVSA